VEGLAIVFPGQRPLRVPRLIASRIRARALLALLVGGLAVAPAARAENRWTLWERPVDLDSSASGEWRRTQTFEAERWCKGAMTTAINQNLLAGWKSGRLDPRAKITEYQCRPEGERPRE
jgi:hypothetical protein